MKLSLIVPVYNTPRQLLEACLRSLMAGAGKELLLEIILADDGSEEPLAAFLNDFADKNSGGNIFFKVLHQKNAGPSAARNAGLALVSGDYFAFADADDKAMPGIYERAVLALEESGADMAVFGFLTRTAEGTEIHSMTSAGEGGASYESLSAADCFNIISGSNFACGGGYPWCRVFRTEAVKKSFGGELPAFDTELYAYEDKLWCLEVIKHLDRVILLPDIGYEYKNDAPSTSKGEEAEKNRIPNVYLAFDRMLDCAWSNETAKALLKEHLFKIIFTDLRRLDKEKDSELYSLCQARMSLAVAGLKLSDMRRLRDKLAYIIMKKRYGRCTTR